MGRVYKINIKNPHGGNLGSTQSCVLIKDKGILGDKNFGKERNISILDRKVREHIDFSKEKGFCMVKFKENICIDGFVDFEYNRGSYIHLGECTVEILKVGKNCHSDCQLFREGRVCPVAESVIFGTVCEGGALEEGDDVWIEF